MFRKRILISLVTCLVLATAAVAADQPNYLKFTLLTTNDLHANLVPFNQPDKFAGQIPQIENVGGAARRATFVNRVRAEESGIVLLLDSGDTTFGSNPIAKAYHGAPDVEVLNAMGYVAMEPGNHDFQWQSPDTLRNLKASHFPWICANLVEVKTGKTFLTPYIVKDYNGVRVAFFGLITQLVNSAPYKAREELGLNALEPIGVAKQLVPELRQKADIVICLSHCGVNIDKKMAAEVPGIDIILGGHSHTRLPQPVMIPSGTPSATYIGAVPVVQAFQWGSETGETQVTFRRDAAKGSYSLMSCKGKLVSIDNTLPEDPYIASIVKRYQAKMPKAVPAATPATAAVSPAVAK